MARKEIPMSSTLIFINLTESYFLTSLFKKTRLKKYPQKISSAGVCIISIAFCLVVLVMLIIQTPALEIFREDLTLLEWMAQWKKEEDDEQKLRSVLGRLLFSQDETKKSVNIISGGEQGRMLFGKLMLQQPNVLVMDEPTNHLDMESIESLNTALENYPGTLIFVSHDREIVLLLATRIIEITPTGIVDFHGGYEEYLEKQGVLS